MLEDVADGVEVSAKRVELVVESVVFRVLAVDQMRSSEDRNDESRAWVTTPRCRMLRISSSPSTNRSASLT